MTCLKCGWLPDTTEPRAIRFYRADKVFFIEGSCYRCHVTDGGDPEEYSEQLRGTYTADPKEKSNGLEETSDMNSALTGVAAEQKKFEPQTAVTLALPDRTRPSS